MQRKNIWEVTKQFDNRGQLGLGIEQKEASLSPRTSLYSLLVFTRRWYFFHSGVKKKVFKLLNDSERQPGLGTTRQGYSRGHTPGSNIRLNKMSLRALRLCMTDSIPRRKKINWSLREHAWQLKYARRESPYTASILDSSRLFSRVRWEVLKTSAARNCLQEDSRQLDLQISVTKIRYKAGN